MEEILEEVKKIEEEMDGYQKEYAEECALISKQKGFDLYKPKWKKKIKAIADKYAEMLIPLEEKHNELRAEVDRMEEEKRKSKYKDVY